MSKDGKSTNHNINSEQKHNTMKEMDNMKETETLKTRMNNLGVQSGNGRKCRWKRRKKEKTHFLSERTVSVTLFSTMMKRSGSVGLKPLVRARRLSASAS